MTGNGNNQFFPGSNVQVPGGCGAGINAPLVGTFNYTPDCPPSSGAINPNVPSQTTFLQSGTTKSIQWTITNTTLDSIWFHLGRAAGTCLDLILNEANISPDAVVVGPGSVIVSGNRLSEVAACYLDQDGVMGFNFFARTNDPNTTSLRGIQSVFTPFDPCFLNDVELPCTDSCGANNSQFYGTGFYAGENADVLFEIPAETTTVIKVCNCIAKTVSLVSSTNLISVPTPVPAMAACVPNGNGF